MTQTQPMLYYAQRIYANAVTKRSSMGSQTERRVLGL